MTTNKMIIPWWEKLNLTIEEAAAYSDIGENTLRSIINENPNEDFILYIGRKKLIKRKEFEKWNTKKQFIR